jgi:DNA-binding transcriptional regulator YbjK
MARRKHNAPERRRELADAAIELLGQHGPRGLSHPKVDDRAGVPVGTTSFYFRTRQALLYAAATRLTELDTADLFSLSELAGADAASFSGTSGLARIVMFSATEPWLTRAKARYELLLQAGRDPELATLLDDTVEGFYGLARDVVSHWQSAHDTPNPDLIDQQALATLAFINGTIMTFVAGKPIVTSAEQLDRLIQGVISGVGQTYLGPA